MTTFLWRWLAYLFLPPKHTPFHTRKDNVMRSWYLGQQCLQTGNWVAVIRTAGMTCYSMSCFTAFPYCYLGRVMRKRRGRHDTCFRVICIWNHLLKMAAVIGFSFKERFLRFWLLFSDFYHFHHVIWGMKLAKKLKTKNGQNMSSGAFSHDVAHFWE